MFALIGIVIGLSFAYYGFKRGFFEMWGNFFNLLIAVYLALFLKPVITEHISGAGDTWIGIFLTVFLTGLVVFFILYGISYIAFGQFEIELPKFIDISIGALTGFLGGLLIWSCLIFLFSITPLSHNKFAQNIGLAEYSIDHKTTYMCFWGDSINFFAASNDAGRSTKEVLDDILKSAVDSYTTKRTADSETPGVTDPNESTEKTIKPIEEELGPPPELDFDVI